MTSAKFYDIENTVFIKMQSEIKQSIYVINLCYHHAIIVQRITKASTFVLWNKQKVLSANLWMNYLFRLLNRRKLRKKEKIVMIDKINETYWYRWNLIRIRTKCDLEILNVCIHAKNCYFIVFDEKWLDIYFFIYQSQFGEKKKTDRSLNRI